MNPIARLDFSVDQERGRRASGANFLVTFPPHHHHSELSFSSEKESHAVREGSEEQGVLQALPGEVEKEKM